jgi:hypothetical protein
MANQSLTTPTMLKTYNTIGKYINPADKNNPHSISSKSIKKSSQKKWKEIKSNNLAMPSNKTKMDKSLMTSCYLNSAINTDYSIDPALPSIILYKAIMAILMIKDRK